MHKNPQKISVKYVVENEGSRTIAPIFEEPKQDN